MRRSNDFSQVHLLVTILCSTAELSEVCKQWVWCFTELWECLFSNNSELPLQRCENQLLLDNQLNGGWKVLSAFFFLFKYHIYVKAKWWLLRLEGCLSATRWAICLRLPNSYSSLKTERKCLLSLEALQLCPKQNQVFLLGLPRILC